MGAPIIASLLCLLPMYAIVKRRLWRNTVVVWITCLLPYWSADHPEHRIQTVLIRNSGEKRDE